MLNRMTILVKLNSAYTMTERDGYLWLLRIKHESCLRRFTLD